MLRLGKYILLFWFFLNPLWARTHSPLPVDQAFIFSISYRAPVLYLNWQIAPNYYLYRDRIQLMTDNNAPFDVDYPQGDLKYSEQRGRFEVYQNNVSFPIPIKPQQLPLSMIIKYQGCAEDGFCYPPQVKHFLIHENGTIEPKIAAVDLPNLLINQNKIASILLSDNLIISLSIFFILGVLLAFTPCVLPMVPILTSIIVGQKKVTTKKAFCLSLSYVLGIAVVYALAGLIAAELGSTLQVWLQKPLIILLVASLLVLLGLSLFGLFHLRLPAFLQQPLVRLNRTFQGGSYLSVFFMGAVSTLIISPCVTAPLVGILIYIGQTGNVWLGGSALFVMGLGMGMPLLLLGISANHWLPKTGPWMEAIKMAFGLLMLAMAIWLASRVLTFLQTFILSGLFLIACLWLIGWYLAKLTKRKRFIYCITIAFAMVIALLLLGSLFAPTPLEIGNKPAIKQHYISVTNVAAIQQQLQLAKANHQPVMIDFYADWCESCVTMEKKVFNNPEVQSYLKSFIYLRADVTANDLNAQTMLTYFKVIAPPTILFFDTQGNELVRARVVGEISAKQFISQLQTLNINQKE